MMNRLFTFLFAASCLTAVGQIELIPDTAEFNFFECDSLQWNQMTFFDDTTAFHQTPCGEFYEFISEVEQEMDVDLLNLLQEGSYSGVNIAANEYSSTLWGEYLEDFNDGAAQGWEWIAEVYINGYPMGGASFTGGSFYVSSCCDSGGNQHVKVTSPNFQASTGYFIESVSFSGGASASGNHPPSTWGVSRIRINNGGWQEFTGQPVIPEGTHTVRLEFEALGSWNASVNLDNVHVVATNSVLGLPHTPELLTSCNAKVEQLNLTIQDNGCSDEEACNYVASDVCTNSCVYAIMNNDCEAGEIACGIGTKWNPELQKCEVFRPADTNFDGCVQLNDMLNLLSDYGLCFCDGEYDECGVCNGSGPSIPIIESIEILYDSVYADQIDEWFVFETGVDTTYQFVCEYTFGCTDQTAFNYNPAANSDDGSCILPFEECGDAVIHEGEVYSTVAIGDQCWYRENVRFLPAVSPPTTGSEDDGGAHAYVLDYFGADLDEAKSMENFPSQGSLFNYVALVEWEICPVGWHLPTDEEFQELELFLGIDEAQVNQFGLIGIDEAELLKASPTDTPSWNGTNDYGFSAIPSGSRWFLGESFSGPESVWFSTSDLYSADRTIAHRLYESLPQIERNRWGHIHDAHSVRCIKDTE